MTERTWASIARPVEATKSESDNSQADGAQVSTRRSIIVIPRSQRLTTSRSIGQTRLGSARPTAGQEVAKPRPPVKFISSVFPTDWYANTIKGLPESHDPLPAVSRAEEPLWHRIFNHARKHLFAEQFETPDLAYSAGENGLADLAAAVSSLDGLNDRDRLIACVALQKHANNQPCPFC